MSGKTPGPFSRVENCLLRQTDIPGYRFIGRVFGHFTRDESEAARDEVVELLNRGTHFDGMLKSLKNICRFAGPDAVPSEHLDAAFAAIAAAEGEGE